MKNYNTTYEAVLELNWFIFNDLLSVLNTIESDEDYRALRVADHHLIANSKETGAFSEYYEELIEKMKYGVKINVNHEAEWERLIKDLGGE